MGAARLSMRVAGKWQRHTSTIYIPGVNRVLESIKSHVVPRLLIPTYYSAVVARRYLKSDMSNTNATRRRRMSRESLTVGFLLLFEEPFAIRPGRRLRSVLFRIDSHLATVPELHGD